MDENEQLLFVDEPSSCLFRFENNNDDLFLSLSHLALLPLPQNKEQRTAPSTFT